MKITTKILVACLPGIVTGALFAATTSDQTVSKTKANDTALTKAKASMAKMPLSFEPNRGQTDPRVQFLSRGPGYTVFFTKDQTVISLKDTKTSNAVVRMKFVGGSNSGNAEAIEPLTSTTNYLIGNDPSKWQTDVKEYTKLRYTDVYPGIDVVYQGNHQQLRYDFIVKPGASANAIAMAFEGASNIAVNKDGDLVLTIGNKTLVTRKPFTYQEDGGAKKEVASHFVVKDGRVTFELAKYDTTKDLIIDPSVVFISYLGGLLNDSVNGVAIVNTFQNVASQPSFYYVTGSTTSANFPGVTGEFQAAQAGVTDAFVSKISYNGATLSWSTYLGGNNQDTANAIAVDITSPAGTAGGTAGCTVSGCPVIVGQTYSLNFPLASNGTINVVPSGAQSALSGTDDAFAAKLSSDGKTLIFSEYIGGVTNDDATGVALDQATPSPNIYVGGYTDSPLFLGKTNAGVPTSSSDAFIVKLTGAGATPTAMLYGGFGEEFARGIAYNPTSKMVYIAGDTTSAPQNFPLNTTNNFLPGVTNATGTQYTVNGVATGLPGPGTGARGGFVAAFDATTLVKTFASYVAVSPATGTCGTGLQNTPCNVGTESINGLAVEGGAPAVCTGATCTPNALPTGATYAATAGSVGHIYLTGVTTSNVPTSSIAIVVPNFACASALNATDGSITTSKTGQTIASGCTTALVTQAPFNQNYANNTSCPYPLVLPLNPNATCNTAAFVAILDGALLTGPAAGATVAGIGNQIEYFAYYSSVLATHHANAPDTYANMGNSSATSNAIAIDVNPTTATSIYSLGYYQQMYITGSTTITSGTSANLLPTTTYPSSPSTNEIFTPYNVGTTTGGGTGGLEPVGFAASSAIPNPTSAFIARFNPNGVVANGYGGLTNYGGNSAPVAPQVDRSPLIHTPQFNYGEFLYSVGGAANLSGVADTTTPSAIGNAIAVDITRAVLIGGVTNNSQANTSPAGTTAGKCPGTPFANACLFTTSNTFTGGTTLAGGTDGWVTVLFFNDILSNANATATANPFLEPPNNGSVLNNVTGTSYLQTSASAAGGLNGTPPPFGPTFDFAISDPSTLTQTFQVIFTGQTSGQLVAQTPFFVPLDARSGANPPIFDNNNPGSGIVYYLPCWGPGGNPYPAPGGPYGPLGIGAASTSCPDGTLAIPPLYQALGATFSGWPGITAVSTTTTPGWLLVSQDINPGVVRLQLDRRAAAGLLEGSYVAQFLVNTYDPNQNLNASHPYQWPPCAVGLSEINPYVGTGASIIPTISATPTCTTPLTPLPADNESILVTVRLVVRPSLFLSRNAGFLTGITGNLQTNPIYGPVASIGFGGVTQQDGTSQVPDWLYADNATTLTVNNPSSTSPAGPNSGPETCYTAAVASTDYTTSPGGVYTGVLTAGAAGPAVALPCVVAAGLSPAPYSISGIPVTYAAAAYAGNGPGDVPGSVTTPTPTATPATIPNMTFIYDAGTISTPNIAPQQGLVTARPDSGQPNSAFNADFQGGIDPETQRNDATVHDYYIEAEGEATLSIAAINCTNWNPAQGHNAAVGNWLSVAAGVLPLNGAPASYLPICTDLNVNTLGTTTPLSSGTGGGVVTACPLPATCNFTIPVQDDSNVAPLVGGRKISLDFLAKAFSNRPKANGIPTGVYTAQVYVWSTRAKNSVPGYCLGASMPASSSTTGLDPLPLCGNTVANAFGPASDGNPNPEVAVTYGQTFNVTLIVLDSTQVIQITQNSCPNTGFTSGSPITQFVQVSNSENDFTGNPLTGFGATFTPPSPLAQTYPGFGLNGDDLVVFSLLPFQTTGMAITQPCSSNNSVTCPVGTGSNITIPLPAGVTVNAQTLAQYNACALPTGLAGTTPINGTSVPGIGTLQQVGALSQTTFVPNPNGSNANATIYACRPTVAPAWLATVPGTSQVNSASFAYPGNALSFAGAPEPYGSGNGATSDPVPSVSAQTCPLNGTTIIPPPTIGTGVGVFRGGNSYLEDSNNNRQYDTTDVDITTFAPPGGFKNGDIPVTGDWNGSTHWKVGVYRPSTGTWWLDTNGDGLWDAADQGYPNGVQFGGLAGDAPVTGDWTLAGKSCIGIYRNGGVWLLDLNCNGTYDGTPTDAFFPFGGLVGDVPVVGAWVAGAPTRVGVVRAYAPGGLVGQCNASTNAGCPFFWLEDSANPNSGTLATTHQPSPGAFAFGGLYGDVFVTGDWLTLGYTRAGVYRQGIWLLDEGLNGATNHTYDTFFGYGGLSTDVPITGKW